MDTQTEIFVEFLVACSFGSILSITAYNLFDDKYYLERILKRFKK